MKSKKDIFDSYVDFLINMIKNGDYTRFNIKNSTSKIVNYSFSLIFTSRRFVRN